MKITIIIILMTVIVPFCLPAPKSEAGGNRPDASVFAGGTVLGFNMLADLAGEYMDGNVLLSPYGLTVLLSVLYHGAGGPTAGEIAGVMGWSEQTPAGTGGAMKAAADMLEQLGIKTGNSLWKAEELSLSASFSSDVKSFFDMEIFDADPGSAETKRSIDGWTKSVTGGLIETPLPEITPAEGLLIANAVRFDFAWKIRFEKTMTSRQDFFKADGTAVKTEMMRCREKFELYQYPEGDVVFLPYSVPGAYMAAAMAGSPAESAAILQRAAAERRETPAVRAVDVSLPRFDIVFTTELQECLKRSGFGISFSADADYSGISQEFAFTADVLLQSVSIRVDESGTEGAAASYVFQKGPENGETVRIVFNRPFVFAVILNDICLMTGYAGNPGKK